MEYTLDQEDGKFVVRYINSHVYGVCESTFDTEEEALDMISMFNNPTEYTTS